MTSPYGDRELDVRVAVEVFGWTWRSFTVGWNDRYRNLIDPANDADMCDPECGEEVPLGLAWARETPRYSTDPAAYMAVLSEMTRRGFQWFIHAGFESPIAAGFARPGPTGKTFDSVGEGIGEAICRAALAAVAEEEA